MPRITDKDKIISFLRGIGGDHLNRTLADHWAIDDYEMEKCHDRIQWLFPLHEDSRMASSYPVVTPEIVEEAKKHPEIKENMIKSTKFYLKFLGVTGASDDAIVDLITGKTVIYPIKGNWCRLGDHNLLRITRMLRSLRFFGAEVLAGELYPHFVRIGTRANLGRLTLHYWERAMKDEVWETLY